MAGRKQPGGEGNREIHGEEEEDEEKEKGKTKKKDDISRCCQEYVFQVLLPFL